MCNIPACGFCAFMSAFGTFFMFFLGILIKANYKYVGEWYHPEAGGSPTQDQIDTASTNCFICGGVYIACLVASTGIVMFLRSRPKASA